MVGHVRKKHLGVGCEAGRRGYAFRRPVGIEVAAQALHVVEASAQRRLDACDGLRFCARIFKGELKIRIFWRVRLRLVFVMKPGGLRGAVRSDDVDEEATHAARDEFRHDIEVSVGYGAFLLEQHARKGGGVFAHGP